MWHNVPVDMANGYHNGAGSSGTTCRICQEGDQKAQLVSPCSCSGTIGFVHVSCLERWLNERDVDYCELCGTSYKVCTARKSRKACHADPSVQVRKVALAARDVHGNRYAERSTAFNAECDTTEEEIGVTSPIVYATPEKLLPRTVTPEDDEREWDDVISESALGID
ncbi:hypothetical protein HPB51_009518 [Rhipicephalus microplus]|uniref:RING-CH-type domain-containing protein n=1 Tax=Rhipicephalus microplus TaxID=6941 RepID=A0A9J6EGF0_RHIMP|nr:hypothetical protein HPB51_009518 [Rhipicephalus microplus]